MTHTSNDDLLRYLDGTHERMDDVAQHVQDCATCAARLDALRSFTTRLSTRDVWDHPHPTPPSGKVRELAELDQRLANEERMAEELVPALRDATSITTIPAEWRTAGVVRALLAIVTRERDATPTSSLGLARLARAIANAIPTTAYPSPIVVQLQGHAWKEEANLLRHIGEFQDALDALDHAAACCEAHPTGSYDLALVDLVRALTLSHGMGRPTEAIELLRHAATTFQSYGDARRSLHARLAMAACMFDLGQYREARAGFHALLPNARASRDRETYARLVTNIACCDAELDHLDAADHGFHEAIKLHKDLGLPGELVRARWGLARLRTKRQEYDEAVAQLYAIELEFTSLGLFGEAGLVLLDVVENLLILGRNQEIPTQLSGLVEHFTRAGAKHSAMTALAYLQDAMREERIGRNDVQAVRSWLEHPHEATATFIPPPR